MSDLVCKADKRAYFAFVSQMIVKFPLFQDRNVLAAVDVQTGLCRTWSARLISVFE